MFHLSANKFEFYFFPSGKNQARMREGGALVRPGDVGEVDKVRDGRERDREKEEDFS